MNRNLLARGMVALMLGLLGGYVIGKGMEKDAERGRNLTLKEYVSEFEAEKAQLSSAGDSPLAVMVLVGTLVVVVFFGLYELLVFGADRLLGALDRRRNAGYGQPGTPPPW
jgi:hypothetical protein